MPLFAVPFAGIAFTLKVTRHHRWRALLPAVVSAFTGKLVVDALGYEMGLRPQVRAPDWTIGLPFKLLLAGVAFGLLGRLFVGTLKMVRFRMGHYLKWPPIRAVVGGGATLGLMALLGRDYLGLSLPLMGEAFAGGHIDWWVPLIKLVFTIVALGTGFVGGEVTPLLVMGGTMGGAIAPGLHASPVLAGNHRLGGGLRCCGVCGVHGHRAHRGAVRVEHPSTGPTRGCCGPSGGRQAGPLRAPAPLTRTR